MLKLIWNDILKEKADVIVTPASREPRIGTGLDKIIHNAAGPELLSAREKMGYIEPGIVHASPSYGIKKLTGAKYVIHALGPFWNDTSDVKDELILDGTYLHILLKALELKCKSIAIPVMSSGKFGMPMNKAVDIAVKAIQLFLKSIPVGTIEVVKLVGIDSEFYMYAKKEYPTLVAKSVFTTEAEKKYRATNARSRTLDVKEQYEAFTLGEKGYFQAVKLASDVAGRGFKEFFQKLWNEFKAAEKAAKIADHEAGKPPRVYIVSNSLLAQAAIVSDKTIKNYCELNKTTLRASKDKIIALGIAMRLSLPYVRSLLKTCNFALNSKNPRDKVIIGFVGREGAQVHDLNLELQKNGFEPLATLVNK